MFGLTEEMFEKLEKVLYGNIGKKIKRMAMITFFCEMVAAIIGGFFMLIDGDFFSGLCIMIGGSLAAWVVSWALYGVGELIDKVSDIQKNVCKEESEEQ